MTPWWSKPTSDGAAEKRSSDPSERPEKGAPEKPEQKPAPKEPQDARPASEVKDAEPKKSEPQAAAEASAPKPGQPKSRPSRSRTRKPKRTEEKAAEPAPTPEEDEGRGGSREADPLASRTRRSRSSRRRSARTARAEEGSEDRKVAPPTPATGAEAGEKSLAVFCEVSSLLSEAPGDKVDIRRIVSRLLEKGRVVSKKAYGDWERFSQWKKAFHMAGFQLVEIPGDQEGDLRIQMTVEAMELLSGEWPLVDMFVLVSGDGAFVPLVSALRTNRRQVIGMGRKDQVSPVLVECCDEFLYYEELPSGSLELVGGSSLSDQEQEVFVLLADAVLALIRENKEVLWGSMVKQAIQRKHPSFNEASYGYSTFSDLLADAEQKKMIQLKRDERSGSLIVTDFVQGQ